MNRAQSGRGPDASYTWSDGRVSLGCVRLQITGDAQQGQQPLADEAGGLTVYNGEIYSSPEVASVQGVVGRSDGQVLAEVLAQSGHAGLADLKGMFAAVRYDPRSGTVLLVRDPMGQKSLYLRQTPQGWVFASTLAAVHAGSGPMGVRDDAMIEYAVFRSVGGYRSAFEGVEQLPPGGWMTIAPDGRTESGRWWTLPETCEGIADATDVRGAVDRAVYRRATPGHELGLFLSGGLDSAIVTASLHRQHSELPKRVFTVGYDIDGWQDERGHAARLAETLGLEWEDVVLDASQVPGLLEAVAIATEDPNQDPVTLPTMALCRHASLFTKVALTGDGSDEIWGGYERFDDCPSDLASYLERAMTFRPTDLGLTEFPRSYLDGIPVPSADLAPLDRVLRIEASNRLRNYHLSRVDKIGMSVGLEIRSPFMDSEVVELGLGLSAAVKRPGGRAKGLLTSAFEDDIPSWLSQRRKQAFSVPISGWLRGSLCGFAHDLLGTSNAFVRCLVDPDPYLAKALSGQLDSRAASQLWSLLQLEVWHRCFAKHLSTQPKSELSSELTRFAHV